MTVYTNNDYRVLKNIMDKNNPNKGLSKGFGTSVKEICEKTKLSDKKIRNSIKAFMEDDMVAYAVADGRTKNYYITEKGIEELFSITQVILEEE